MITADKYSSNITTDIRMRLTNCTVAKEKKLYSLFGTSTVTRRTHPKIPPDYFV